MGKRAGFEIGDFRGRGSCPTLFLGRGVAAHDMATLALGELGYATRPDAKKRPLARRAKGLA
jgi:hypothetical protein